MAKKVTIAEMEEKLEKKTGEVLWHEMQLDRIGRLLYECTGGLPSMKDDHYSMSNKPPSSYSAVQVMGMAGMASGKLAGLEDAVRVERNCNTDLLDRFAPKKKEETTS